MRVEERGADSQRPGGIGGGEVAGSVVHLAPAAADHITGATLYVDGGMLVG